MTMSFDLLLTDCLVALGDTMGSTWSRIGVIDQWCIEAIRSFPIARPMFKDETIAVIPSCKFDLPADFRQIISVEYPINQIPPKYLVRKNRLDPEFYIANGFYDVDHNYTDGLGWVLYSSEKLAVGVHVYIQYLADHDTDMTDDDSSILTIPDEYYSILISSVMCRAYRERLSFMMQDPTAHMTVITQMTEMVQHMEERFAQQVASAQARLANSIVSPRLAADRFDRVY